MLQAELLRESALLLKSFLYNRFGSWNNHLQTLSKVTKERFSSLPIFLVGLPVELKLPHQ